MSLCISLFTHTHLWGFRTSLHQPRVCALGAPNVHVGCASHKLPQLMVDLALQFILVSQAGGGKSFSLQELASFASSHSEQKTPSFSSSVWVDLSGLRLALSSEVFSAPGRGCWCFWKEFAAFTWCSLQISNHCLVVVHAPILLPWVCPSTQTSVGRCRKALFDVLPH